MSIKCYVMEIWFICKGNINCIWPSVILTGKYQVEYEVVVHAQVELLICMTNSLLTFVHSRISIELYWKLQFSDWILYRCMNRLIAWHNIICFQPILASSTRPASESIHLLVNFLEHIPAKDLTEKISYYIPIFYNVEQKIPYYVI